MHKQLFDRAIGEAPPSTVDVDAVIARARRGAWVHRAANPWVATAAGVIAVTVGATVAMLPGGSAGPAASGGAPPPTTSPSSASSPPQILPCRDKPTMVTPGQPAPPPPTIEPTVPEQAAELAQRLTGALTAAAHAQLPADATLQPNPVAEHPKGTPHGPLEFYWSDFGPKTEACPYGQSDLMARATVVKGTQRGNIMALVDRQSDDPAQVAKCGPEGIVSDVDESCAQQTGPNGEAILVITMKLKGGGPTVNRIQVTKSDGTAILLQAENVARDAKEGGKPQSPTPPLTHRQLITIALDPAMTISAR